MLCEKMGWTYMELQEQPQFFIERILAKWSTDGRHNEDEIKKVKQSSKMKSLRRR